MSEIMINVNDLKQEDLPQLQNLLQQLDAKMYVENQKIIEKIEHWQEVMKANFVITARQNNRLVGMATLVPHIQGFGKFGNVQDVVVDEEIRGGGIGSLLITKLIDMAKENYFSKLELTSSKPIAQEWYKKIGFAEHPTKVFKKGL